MRDVSLRIKLTGFFKRRTLVIKGRMAAINMTRVYANKIKSAEFLYNNHIKYKHMDFPLLFT